MHGLQGPTVGILVDTQLVSDCAGSRELVPRDHYCADAGRAAGRDGRPSLFAQRILHAHQPNESQIPANLALSVGGRQLLIGQSQHSQAGAGQLLVSVQDLLAASRRHGCDPGRRQLAATRGEECGWRAFHVGNSLLPWRVMHRDHALLAAVEG